MVTALVFHACSSPDKSIRTRDSLASSHIKKASPDTAYTIFKGLYTFGDEVSSFRDCEQPGKVYWVNDSLISLRDQYDKTNRLPTYPYESVYAELKGYLSGKSTMGYASEYENVLVVSDIIKMEAKNFRTECYNFEFIILGNEPFWSLDIIPDEQRIVLKEAGMDKVTEFIYTPSKVDNGVYRYDASNPARDKLSVTIRKENCSDGMSDRQYSYAADLVVNGKVYKGCAIKRGDRFADLP